MAASLSPSGARVVFEAHGELFSVPFTIAGDAALGSYPLTLSAVVMSDILEVAATDVVLDEQPPGVLQASVAYTPGPDNPLATPTRATRGTLVQATIIPDEALDPSAGATLLAHGRAYIYTSKHVELSK